MTLTVSLAAGIGFSLGYNSEEFALALVFALIVLHDAMGVRRLTGKHSRVFQQLLEKIEGPDSPGDIPVHTVGHNSQEVLAGALIGVVVAGLVFGRGSVVWEAARHFGYIFFHFHLGL